MKRLDLGLLNQLGTVQHNPAQKVFLFPAFWVLSVTEAVRVEAVRAEAVRAENVRA
jgi:hypothetical protein